METHKMSIADFRKTSLKGAIYAHVSVKSILIRFKTKVNGAYIEYGLEFPNEGTIPVNSPRSANVRSFYINNSLVGYLKDLTGIDHFPDNGSPICKGENITTDTVILYTRKGRFEETKFSIGGKSMYAANVEAMYNK